MIPPNPYSGRERPPPAPKTQRGLGRARGASAPVLGPKPWSPQLFSHGCAPGAPTLLIVGALFWRRATKCWSVFQLPRWHRSSESCTQQQAPFWISNRVTVWLQLFQSCTGCQSLKGSSTSCACWFTSRFWDTRRIYLRPSDIGCQYSRSVYTTRLIVWQPRRAVDTSTNRRQSLFCCCTASMEQATDRAETAAIDGLVSSWSEHISVWFCLRAPRYGFTLWCADCLLVGGAMHQLQLQLEL